MLKQPFEKNSDHLINLRVTKAQNYKKENTYINLAKTQQYRAYRLFLYSPQRSINKRPSQIKNVVFRLACHFANDQCQPLLLSAIIAIQNWQYNK